VSKFSPYAECHQASVILLIAFLPTALQLAKMLKVAELALAS